MGKFDPFAASPRLPQDVILATCVSQGNEEVTANFQDECFVLADGVLSLPHATEAAKIASETATWAYSVVRQRHFYWTEKLELVKRIFRTTNLRLWQKRRDAGFSDGLAAALMVLIVIKDYFWIGSAGNCNAILCREGLIDVLTPRDVEDGSLTKAAGFSRKQLIPTMRSERLLKNDVILMATDGIMDYVSEDEIRTIVETTESSKEMLQQAVDQLFAVAQRNGSHHGASACMVKRVTI